MAIRPALVLPPEPDDRWDHARQLGLDAAVTRLPRDGDGNRTWDVQAMTQLKQAFADVGMDATVIEDYPPMQQAILGGPGHDEEIEGVCEMLRAMGAVGIPVWCWAWMATIHVQRTSVTAPLRGGSLTTRYDHDLMARAGPAGDVDEDELWENLEYFLERVVPVAEDAGVKLALHPDDPPLPRVRGIPRIASSPERIRRILDLYPSDNHGVTFCQGNFAAMGVDVPETIREFADDVHFVHFRDVVGTAERFQETWHDEGPTDMLAAMRAYVEHVDGDVPMRPDHVPTMVGESNETPGYHTKGRLFAIGYMRGLLEQTDRDG